MATTSSNSGDVITRSQAAMRYGVSTRTLDRLMKSGKFPRPDVVLSQRTHRWTQACLDRFFAVQAQAPMSNAN
jgi:predicted DNA-binding transcriptional regulator AlpA